jgi:outer membrane lipoprotein
MQWQWFVWGLAALLGAGCSHALSPAVRQQIDTTLSLTQLRTSPEAYKDRIVMLGGEILSTSNLPEGTLLEVLQKPLDATDRPLATDRTEGRFMALCEEYLDPAIYSKGRLVTLAGRVLGTRTNTVGEIPYVYPLLACLEVYLWPLRPDTRTVYPYDYWWPWYPAYWWRPYPFHRF